MQARGQVEAPEDEEVEPDNEVDGVDAGRQRMRCLQPPIVFRLLRRKRSRCGASGKARGLEPNTFCGWLIERARTSRRRACWRACRQTKAGRTRPAHVARPINTPRGRSRAASAHPLTSCPWPRAAAQRRNQRQKQRRLLLRAGATPAEVGRPAGPTTTRRPGARRGPS